MLAFEVFAVEALFPQKRGEVMVATFQDVFLLHTQTRVLFCYQAI